MLTSEQGKQACERIMKHTQTQWEAVGGFDDSCEVNIGDTIASFVRYDRNTGENVISREEMEANATLAASSPFMLLALMELQGMEHHITDPGLRAKFVDRVYSAIEKALK